MGRRLVARMKGRVGGLVTASRRPNPVDAEVPHAVLDGTREDSLRAWVRGLGAVIDASGPFSDAAWSLRAACAATGVLGCDLVGEQRPLREMLSRPPPTRGPTWVCGVGVEGALVDWAVDLLAPEGSGALHVLVASRARGFRPSRGSTLSALEVLGDEGWALEAGVLAASALGRSRCQALFEGESTRRTCLSFPGPELVLLSRGPAPIMTARSHLPLPRSLEWGRGLLPPMPPSLSQALARGGRLLASRLPTWEVGQGLEEPETRFDILVRVDAASARPRALRLQGGGVYALSARIVELVVAHLLSQALLPGRPPLAGYRTPREVMPGALALDALRSSGELNLTEVDAESLQPSE